MRSLVLASALLTALFPFLGFQSLAFGQKIEIAQSVEQSKPIDVGMVEQLSAFEQHISFMTGHGTEQATYTGALLWTVLEHEGVLDSEPRARLRRTVAVTGRDGYVAVLALAEIDPEFDALVHGRPGA